MEKWDAQSIHSVFVDFGKTYDSVDKPALYNILSSSKITHKLIKMIKVDTNESGMVLRTGADVTAEVFAVANGLNQGDALSPILYNLALEHVIRTQKTVKCK